MKENRLFQLNLISLIFCVLFLGNVLYKDIFVSFPFRNSIDLVEMYGESLLKSLEVSDFLQVAGKL